jgi:hypothetical protein
MSGSGTDEIELEGLDQLGADVSGGRHAGVPGGAGGSGGASAGAGSAGGAKSALKNTTLGCRHASALVCSLTLRLSSKDAGVDFPGLSTAVIALIAAFLAPAGFLSSFHSVFARSWSATTRQWAT